MEKKEWLQEIDELVVEQGMKIIVDEEFSFDKAPQAFEKLNKGKSRGKIVVNVKSPI
jgi:NADPH:quinone reductase-like Zn-dependent oxidoreductase